MNISKHKPSLALAVALSVFFVGCSKREAPAEAAPEATVSEPKPLVPTSNAEKLAYSLGYLNGTQLTEYPDLPVDFLSLGMNAGYSSTDPLLDSRDMQSRVLEARRLAGERRQAERDQRSAERAQQAAERAQQGQDWLAANANEEGVQITESGLQYLVIKGGDGPKPTTDSRVTVHYTGTLIDGTKFDSSFDRGRPATFALGNVITGWQEGLQLMGVGDSFRFFIPSELAYGARGAGSSIGPNEVLIFEVDLISFE